MTYRNDLDAAHARIASLEAELARTKSPVVVAPTAPIPKPQPAPRRAGRIHYHHPETYVPLLRVWWTSIRTAFSNLPPLRVPTTEEDNVLLWLCERLVQPLWLLVCYPVFLVAVLGFAALLGVMCVAATPLLLPFIAASRLSFSSTRPRDERGWFHGEAITDAGDAYGFIFIAGLTVASFVLPIGVIALLAR